MPLLFSKRSLDGFVEIDHRESPGFTEAEAVAAGRSYLIGAPKHFKAATFTCSHCDQVLIKNPLRTRERAHCIQCDRDICDPCGVTLKLTSVCQCQAKRINEFMAQACRAAV